MEANKKVRKWTRMDKRQYLDDLAIVYLSQGLHTSREISIFYLSLS